jgi:hypothetical protein
MKIRLLSLLLAGLVSACGGPLGLLPGGKLAGSVRPPPADWATAGEYGFAELETRPEEPYSVNIAYTVLDGQLYANAGDTETQWVINIADDPRVVIRMDDVLYPLTAERVTDVAEIARFGKVWTRQGYFHRDPADLGEVWVYRLIPR